MTPIEEKLSLYFDQNQNKLSKLNENHHLLLVFLRHKGCTFCRETLSDIKVVRSEIESKGIRIALVHMSNEARAKFFFKCYDLEDLSRFSNPDKSLYRLFGLGRAKLSQVFGVAEFVRGFKAAIIERHGVGALDGDGFQMPGVFLLKNNVILNRFIHKRASDRPNYIQFIEDSINESESEESTRPGKKA